MARRVIKDPREGVKYTGLPAPSWILLLIDPKMNQINAKNYWKKENEIVRQVTLLR